MSTISVQVDLDTIVPHLTETQGQTADLVRAIVARRGLGEVVERLVSMNSAEAVLARALHFTEVPCIVNALRELDSDVREEICHHFEQAPLWPKAAKAATTVVPEPQVVGKAGEFVTGGLRWRFVGTKTRKEAEAYASGFLGVWALPTVTEWVRNSEAVEKTLLAAGADSFNEPSELSHVAWIEDGPPSAAWDIEERRLFHGAPNQPAGTFLVKTVEEAAHAE